MIATANFSSAQRISSHRSKRIRSLRKAANHQCPSPMGLTQPLTTLNASSGRPADDAPAASRPDIAFSRSLCQQAALMVFYEDALASLQSQESLQHTYRTPWSCAPFAPLTSITRDASGIYGDRACRCLSVGTRLIPQAQLLTNACDTSVSQASPVIHTAALSKGPGKAFSGHACLQHEQDAVEGSFIIHCELASTAFSRRHEGRHQWLQLSATILR